jgi:GNAT superfamily N-acetyltransferase
LSAIQVKKVETGKDLKEFLLFPWQVYQGDPYWVPPLLVELKEKLDREKSPFYEHAERELFLALADGKVTGRIAAIIDDNHNRFHGEKTAFFGFYESFNDAETAGRLLDAAADWSKERGMDTLRGPMNPSMNDECAFLLEGFDSPPVFMMPYNPPYYLELMKACGLAKAKDMYAFFMTRHHGEAAKVPAVAERMSRQSNIRLRHVTVKTLAEDVKKIRAIYNDAWEKNWGFVPMTEREVSSLAVKLKRIADPSLVILAEAAGRPVGFALGLPNYNEAIKKINGRLTPLGILKLLFYRRKIKGMRVVVFGVLPEYRQTGLSYYLYSELNRNVLGGGYEWGELSWQLEDNDAVNRFNLSVGARIYKKYRIFERPIV